MNATTEPTVIRHGKLLAKRAKTDAERQTWLMRQWSDGTVEQYLLFGSDPGRWVSYEGRNVLDISWDN